MYPSHGKATFITENANFCYKVMPFGLKNANTRYQRLLENVFKDLLWKIIKVYIDDMVVKSTDPSNHLKDLAEIFAELRKHMCLNPEKYIFGVEGGKFLGFMITCRGIEANPENYEAFIDMHNPTNLKEV